LWRASKAFGGWATGTKGFYVLIANLPRSVFWNLALLPLAAISRSMAEYTVVTMLPNLAP
jgi:hypothetical protein